MTDLLALAVLAWKPIAVMAAVIVTCLLAWVFRDHSDAPRTDWPREDWREQP